MYHEAMAGQCFDDEIGDSREVRSALPVGEQVYITARSVTHAMGSNGVAAGERESVVTARGLKRDLGEPPVMRIHGGTLRRSHL